mgnify:CR=1 FL=1
MTDRINKNIRYYLPNDPYYYEVDNLPLQDLLTNDERLQIQIDQLRSQLDVSQGRGSFGELKPFISEGDPGRVFVNPGNFLARMDSASDRFTGLEETQDNQDLSLPTADVKTTDIDSNAQFLASGTARTSLVRLRLNEDGTVPSVPITAGDVEDYPQNSNSLPPAYRLDLVYVKAEKSEDQDGGTPSLSVLRGAYFIRGNDGAFGRSGSNLARYESTGTKSNPRTMIQDVNEVPPVLIEAKTNPSDGKPLFTTVPTSDILNSKSYENTPLRQSPDGASVNVDDLVDYVASQSNSSFGLPICYVLVPFNYIEGTALTEDNLIDIRPFFRSNELTLPERQAIATADAPNILNPFATLRSINKKFAYEINRNFSAGTIQSQIDQLNALLGTLQTQVDDIPIIGEQTVGTSIHWLATPHRILNNFTSTTGLNTVKVRTIPGLAEIADQVTNLLFTAYGFMRTIDSGGFESGAGRLKVGAPGRPLYVGLAGRSSGNGDETGSGGGANWQPVGRDDANDNAIQYQISEKFDNGVYYEIVGYTTGIALQRS